MATSSRRDVKLVVETETIGEDNLRRLADQVRALGKAGDDAAPEFADLANQLDRFARDAGALENLRGLAGAVAQLAEQQALASSTADGLAARLAEQTGAVSRLREQQTGAVAAQRAATDALAAQRKALQDLRAEYDAAGKKTETYAALERSARQAVFDAAQALRDKRNALNDIDAAVAKAEREERKLTTQHERATEAVVANDRALRQRQNALNDATATAQAAGVATADLALAEQTLRASVEATAAAVTRAQQEQVESRRSAAAAVEALAAAQARARLAADSELASIRESAQFIERYDASKRAAAAEALRFVEALEAEAAAAEKASRRMAELDAQARRTAQNAQYVDALSAAFNELDAATARAAQEQDRYAAGLADLEAANKSAADEMTRRMRQASEATRQYEQEQQELAAALRAQAEATNLSNAEALQYVEALDAQAVAADRAARRQAELSAQAAKTAQDAQYVRQVAAAFDAVEAQAAQAAAEVARLQRFFQGLKNDANEVNAAFGQTGVRSFSAIRAEMLNVTNAVARLRSEFAGGSISADELARSVSSAQVRLAALKREMDTVPALPGVFENASTAINGLITRFGALGAAIATLSVAVRPVIEVTVALDQMRRVLTQVTGSSTEAARQIEFVRTTAQRAGQAFTEVGQSYSKFAASALQAGLSTRQVQEAFAAVAIAAGNLGLSSDQAKRALEALGQMASKGVVSMEELRQQLGDALPGVLPLLARELGLTQQQLVAVVESGNLLASEAIPAISRSLRALGPVSGEVSGLVAEWNRLKNVLSETVSIVADGAIGTAIGAVLGQISTAIGKTALAAAYLSEKLTVGFKIIGTSAAALVTGDLRYLNEYLTQISNESEARIDALRSRLGLLGADASAAATGTQSLATATTAATTAAEANAPATTAQAEANTAVATSAQAAATATQAAAAATTEATKATQAAAPVNAATARSLAQLNLALGEQIKSAELATQNAEKHTDATKKASDALERAARVSGDDVRAKQAATQAADANAAAALREASTQDALVAALRTARAEQIRYGEAHGFSKQQIEELTKKLDEKISKATADAEKTREASNLARAEAVARQTVSEALKDNAANLAKFRDAAKAAGDEFARTSARFAEGKATLDQLQEASLGAAKAQALLRDAIADSGRAMEARKALLQADLQITQAGLSAQQSRARAEEILAASMGNTARQLQAQISLKDLEVKQTRASVEAKRQEAELDLARATQERDELSRLGPLSDEKKRELELRIRNAQAKVAEANAGKEAVKVIEAEAEALRRKRSASESTVGQGPSNLSASFDEYNKRDTRIKGYDAQGFRQDASGNRLTAGGQLKPPDNSGDWEFIQRTDYGAYQLAESSDLVVAMDGYIYGYWQRKGGGGRGAVSIGNQPNVIRLGDSQAIPLPTAAPRDTGPQLSNPDYVRQDFAAREAARVAAAGLDRGTVQPGAPNSTAVTTAQGTIYTVNINLGGKTTTVNTSSPNEAADLVEMLRQLEVAAGRGA